MKQIHYALQTCDNKRNTNNVPGWLSESKATFTKTCVNTFFQSIQWCSENYPDYHHVVHVFDDHSTPGTVEYLNHLRDTYTTNRCQITVSTLPVTGIMQSIRTCYEWLRDHGEYLVYQVQDDYLYRPSAIAEMALVFEQIKQDTNSHAVISPHNRPSLWTGSYRYWASPRTLIPGSHRYWIQLYDIPCTFFTSHEEFNKHWDLYENFLNMNPLSPNLEAVTLNYMFTKRGVLGLQPVESLALHMQDPNEMDPFVGWQKQWIEAKSVADKISIDITRKIR
jgi:glycosyltransferase involved in cell wall biosynthesis